MIHLLFFYRKRFYKKYEKHTKYIGLSHGKSQKKP